MITITKIAATLLLFSMLATLSAQNPSAVDAQNGSIAGKLLAMDGTPAANIRVSAMFADNATPENGTALLSIGQTDAGGNYRLENVRPGRYYIAAGFVDSPSYFPGTGDRARATVITIGAKEARTGVDFRMANPTGLRFSGRITRQTSDGTVVPAAPAGAATPPFALVAGGPATQAAQIRMTGIGGAGLATGTAPAAAIAPDGSFEISNVRPGRYDVQLMQPGSSFPRLNVTIDLTEKDRTDFQLTVPFMSALSGTVTIEGGGLLPRLQLALANRTPVKTIPEVVLNMVQANPRVQAGRTFTSQLQTGEYSVSALDLPAGFILKSMTSGTEDLLTNTLKVGATGIPPIKIVLGVTTPSPWVRLSGRIIGRAERYRVVNFNVNAQVLADTLEPDFYLDGSFEFPMVLPGQYMTMTSTLGSPMMRSTLIAGNAGTNDAVIYVPDDANSTAPSQRSSDVRVAGRIVGHARAASGSRVHLINAADGERLSTPVYMDGTFEFAHVIAGTYSAGIYPAIPGASNSTVVVGSTDLRDLIVLVPDTREIAGRILADRSVPIPQSMQISVGSRDKLRVPIAPDGSFSVTLPAGQKIAVSSETMPRDYVVDSIKYGDQDLLANPLKLSGPSSDELRVMLRAATPLATVGGRVVGFASLPVGRHVWLTDTRGNLRTVESGINPDGSFGFTGVPAGTYAVRLSVPGLNVTTSSTPVVVSGGNVAGIEITAPR